MIDPTFRNESTIFLIRNCLLVSSSIRVSSSVWMPESVAIFCWVCDTADVRECADVSLFFVVFVRVSATMDGLLVSLLESRLPDSTLSLSENKVAIYLGRFRPAIMKSCRCFLVYICSFDVKPIFTSNASIWPMIES